MAATPTPEPDSNSAHQLDPVALVGISPGLSPTHTSPGNLSYSGSLMPPVGDQFDPVALVGISPGLSPTHTSPGNLSYPGSLIPPMDDQMDHDTLVEPSSSLSPTHTVADPELLDLLKKLDHASAHACADDSDSEATDTLPPPNRERELLPEGMRRGSSATDLSAGQNSNFYTIIMHNVKRERHSQFDNHVCKLNSVN